MLSPKEKRLGTQSIVVRASVTDRDGKVVSCWSDLSLRIAVRDPLGLPSSLVYGAMAFGSVLGVPFWTWLFTEWSTRQKERRARSKHTTDRANEG